MNMHMYAGFFNIEHGFELYTHLDRTDPEILLHTKKPFVFRAIDPSQGLFQDTIWRGFSAP
jgi:hypothetical protein